MRSDINSWREVHEKDHSALDVLSNSGRPCHMMSIFYLYPQTHPYVQCLLVLCICVIQQGHQETFGTLQHSKSTKTFIKVNGGKI